MFANRMPHIYKYDRYFVLEIHTIIFGKARGPLFPQKLWYSIKRGNLIVTSSFIGFGVVPDSERKHKQYSYTFDSRKSLSYYEELYNNLTLINIYSNFA